MYKLYHGDCLAKLKELADNSVDSIVTDPPYHLQSIVSRFKNTSVNDDNKTGERSKTRADGYARLAVGFMGQQWDGGDIAFKPDVWLECIRVLKPGGHMLAFGGTRTYHRMACAIEDAGFEIRDQLGWLYGTGFPKSHDITKSLDKLEGKTGKYEGLKTEAHDRKWNKVSNEGWQRPWMDNEEATKKFSKQYHPESDIGKKYQGWGTALKPAWEPLVLARKPLEENTIAENVLKHGTGCINIDESRVPLDGESTIRTRGDSVDASTGWQSVKRSPVGGSDVGRWPANVIHDGSEEVLEEFGKYGVRPSCKSPSLANPEGKIFGGRRTQGNLPMDNGSAARFFYSAKASKEDREFENDHPTVKPNALMRYLCRLITPKGGVVLDPFMGSGSTGKAALQEDFSFIGIEREEKYFKIAEKKVASGVTNTLF